jgi:predicted ATPase
MGRCQQLSQLLDCWQEAAGRGAPALMLVDGEAGMGKSRLAEEVAARARLAGATVTMARAVEADAAGAWNCLLALASRELLAARGTGAAAPGALARLAEALPEWADRFPGARGAEAMATGRAFASVLRAAAEEQPVLLVVDDAQWLDRESLLAILATLRDLAGLPLGVLLTVSPRAAPGALDEARARIGRDHPGCAVRLGPLAEADIAELARWALPRLEGEALERLVRRVRTDSAGLPLLTLELVHAVALGLELDPTASWPAPFRTLEETLPGDLPDSVVSAVRVAFNRLGADARAVLSTAAVFGGRCTTADLVTGTGLHAASVTAALDELEWGRWLESDARGYGFVARVVGEIVNRDLVTPGQRRRLRPARLDA